jgi:TPR repeat protein
MFDATKSVEEIRKAADQGDATTQCNLGLRYSKAQGVPQDYQQAVEWYRKAADQGNADAQYNLGLMYREGKGVPKDYQQAVEWYRKAADQGNAAAQFSLACMYGADLQTIICVLGMNGAGNNVPLDNHQATAWFCQRSL